MLKMFILNFLEPSYTNSQRIL